MKKLTLKTPSIKGELLTRKQLKNVLGGAGSGTVMTRILLLLFFVTGNMLTLFAQPTRNTKLNSTQLISAIEHNPKNLDFHLLFFNKMTPSYAELLKQYKVWEKRFQQEGTISYMIGKIYDRMQKFDTAAIYCQKAATLSPNNPLMTFSAWRSAYRIFDTVTSVKYMRKTLLLDKDNPEYLYRQATDRGLIEYTPTLSSSFYIDSLLLSICQRFPDSKYAAASLDNLAKYASDTKTKCIYYNILHQKFKTNQNGWFYGGMSDYIGRLATIDLAEALRIATLMCMEAKINKHIWLSKYNTVKQLYDAQKALDEKRPQMALEILRRINTNGKFVVTTDENMYSDGIGGMEERTADMKVEAEEMAGMQREAYNNSLSNYCSLPTLDRRVRLFKLASDLGISQDSVKKSVKQTREKNAERVSSVWWKSITDSSTLRLEEIKGKTILLTNWRPMVEMSISELKFLELHLKPLMEKFQVTHLASDINDLKDLTERLTSSVRQLYQFKFTPLIEDPKCDYGSLEVETISASHLINDKGLIIFSKFGPLYREENKEILELMIKEMNDDWSTD